MALHGLGGVPADSAGDDVLHFGGPGQGEEVTIAAQQVGPVVLGEG